MAPKRSSTLYACIAAIAFAFALSMLGVTIASAYAATSDAPTAQGR